MPPKRTSKPAVVKKAKYSETLIILDVAKTMDTVVDEQNNTYLDKAIEIVDAILSRNLFSQSDDRFAVMLMGCRATNNPMDAQGISLINASPSFQPVELDWLRFLARDVRDDRDEGSDFLTALLVALDFMKRTNEPPVPQRRTIVLVTNGSGGEALKNCQDFSTADILKSLETGKTELDLDVSVVSTTSDATATLGEDEQFLAQIVTRLGATFHTFDDALRAVCPFVRQKKLIRGQPFSLELGHGIELPISFYLKCTDPGRLKFQYRTTDNQNVKRKTVYSRPLESANENSAPRLDPGPSEVDADGKPVPVVATKRAYEEAIGKDEVVKGYLFGASYVVVNEEDELAHRPQLDGQKRLQLVHFAKQSAISRSLWTGKGSRYCIGASDKKNDERAFSAFVETLRSLKVVAICRHTYNRTSHPRLIALYPHLDESLGVPVLIAVSLAFSDDVLPVAFPDFMTDADKPTLEQRNLIEQLVTSMQLEDAQGAEMMKIGAQIDPNYQNQCQEVKRTALGLPSGSVLDAKPARSLLDGQMSLHPLLRDRASGLAARLAAPNEGGFEVIPLVKEQRRRAKVPSVSSTRSLHNMLERFKTEGDIDVDEEMGVEQPDDVEPSIKREQESGDGFDHVRHKLVSNFEKYAEEILVKAELKVDLEACDPAGNVIESTAMRDAVGVVQTVFEAAQSNPNSHALWNDWLGRKRAESSNTGCGIGMHLEGFNSLGHKNT